MQLHLENEGTGFSQRNHSLNHFMVKHKAKDRGAANTQDIKMKCLFPEAAVEV